MQIVKTWDELNPLIAGQTVGNIALARKKSAAQLHAGHLSLVEYTKSNFDVCLVSFWDPVEFIYWFYTEQNIVEDLEDTVWDSTGCLDWCLSNGVDVVILPDAGYTDIFMNGYDKVTGKSNVATIWAQRGYPEVTDEASYNYFRSPKSIMMYIDWQDKPAGFTYINTWKDGCSRYVLEDHLNRIRSDYYLLLDPVVNPDGIYYSSASETYNQDEIDLVTAIPGVVDSVGYDDTTALIEALLELDPGGTLQFDPYRIHVTYGGIVGEANDFIEIFYSLGTYPSGKVRADMYPIRKLNVR